MDCDLLVLGGGAAGIAAARAGVRAGARTVLVNDGPPGGDCTFVGCVPSKTLIEAAAHGHAFPTAMREVRDTVARVAATEDGPVLRGEGIEYLRGRAAFASSQEALVDGRRVRAGRIVLATGSRPAIPSIPGLRDIGYLTNESVFELGAQPQRLAVLGGGVIGRTPHRPAAPPRRGAGPASAARRRAWRRKTPGCRTPTARWSRPPAPGPTRPRSRAAAR